MLPEFLPEPVFNRFIEEPARSVPVLTRCDVAVFGGGPAGVCAAAAAARMGKKVLLVERHGFLGGMATAANVNIWHSLYGTDFETKVISGLPEEIIQTLHRQKAARNSRPEGTGSWFICTETAKLTLDELMLESGVRLLLHTLLVDVIKEDDRVMAALVESKTGRHAIEADIFIDCTGDADLIRRTGEPTQLGGHNGWCQPPSLCFRMGGIKDEADRGEIQAELFRESMDYNGKPYPCFLWWNTGIWDSTEKMICGVRVPGINASDTLDLTRAEIEGRAQLRWFLKKLRQFPSTKNACLRDIATQIGVRESHRIIPEHMLGRLEILEGQRFEDGIAQGTYPIDIHNPGGAGIAFELLDGRRREIRGDDTTGWSRWDGQPDDAPPRTTLCWQVPYRSLIPRRLKNVLAAGRCIGADHEAAGAVRVMVAAMQFGQAAGTAAALAVKGGEVRSISGLTSELLAQGVPIQPVWKSPEKVERMRAD